MCGKCACEIISMKTTTRTEFHLCWRRLQNEERLSGERSLLSPELEISGDLVMLRVVPA